MDIDTIIPPNFMDTEYDGKVYTVPETGRNENLGAMLTDIPDDDHAMAFLMQDGNLACPCSRYGRRTADLAPLAIVAAKIMQHHSGDAMSYHGLDSDMGLLVNDSDGIGYLIYSDGWMVFGDDWDPADLLDAETIESAREYERDNYGE
jgi:hypothetical protein